MRPFTSTIGRGIRSSVRLTLSSRDVLRIGIGIAHEQNTSGPADVLKPPTYLGFMPFRGAYPERFGF
jgi:hypothetical protein